MRLITAIQKYFNSLDFGNEDRNRRALYVQWLALMIVVTTGVLSINYIIAGEALVVGLMLCTALTFALIIALVRAQHLDLGLSLFMACSLLITTVGLFMKNGIRGAGSLVYPALLIFAGLFLTRKGFITFTLLTLGGMAALILAEHQNILLVKKFDEPNLTLFFTYSLLTIVTAFIVRFVIESWQFSLVQAKRTQEELKKQKNLLETSEARWRTLVLNAPVLIININRAGVITFINSESQNQVTAAQGLTIFDFLPPHHQAEARQAVDTCFTSGQPSQHEWPALNFNPKPTWYNINFGPVLENGVVSEIIIIATDITSQKQAETNIRKLNAELDERIQQRAKETDAAYRELEMFSYAVSHNLRTPARGMTGFAEMLLRDHAEQLDSFARNLLRKISANAITMGLMIDDLLEFLQLGRVPLKIRETAPTLLAQNALESLPAYRDAHNIQIKIDPMPHVNADADLLTRVFSNLIDNAIKFTRERKEAVIHIGTLQTEAGQTFFVRDNGIGFDMQYVGKLFGVFQQLHRPGEYEGTGVGLATVQRIIRRHGGHVWAEAELNKGATFYFTL